MTELSYSNGARNVLNRFHRVEKILYVEGDDDVLFWELIFNQISNFSVKVKEVGGKKEIVKTYINEVIANQANYLIAIDSDFDKLTSEKYHPNIISTFGYSIENTIITDLSLTKVLRTLCKMPGRDVPESLSREWIIELEKSITPLVLHAIVNDEDRLGYSVIPQNSDRFMKSQKSCQLCEQKIKDHLDQLSIEISEERKAKIYEALSKTKLSIIDMLLGHFLFSAASRLMRIKVEELKTKVSISNDMLFSSLLLAFESLFDSTHPHYDHYKTSIDSIIMEV